MCQEQQAAHKRVSLQILNFCRISSFISKKFNFHRSKSTKQRPFKMKPNCESHSTHLNRHFFLLHKIGLIKSQIVADGAKDTLTLLLVATVFLNLKPIDSDGKTTHKTMHTV